MSISTSSSIRFNWAGEKDEKNRLVDIMEYVINNRRVLIRIISGSNVIALIAAMAMTTFKAIEPMK